MSNFLLIISGAKETDLGQGIMKNEIEEIEIVTEAIKRVATGKPLFRTLAHIFCGKCS